MISLVCIIFYNLKNTLASISLSQQFYKVSYIPYINEKNGGPERLNGSSNATWLMVAESGLRPKSSDSKSNALSSTSKLPP